MKDIATLLEDKIKLQKELIGKPFTALWINSMAMTTTLLGKCIDVVFPPSGEPHIIFKMGRERKLRTMKIKPDILIFAGQKIPVLSDFEADLGMWHGNACLNVAGPSPDETRQYIEDHNLNPYFNDQVRAKIIHHAKGVKADTIQTLLYPEIYTSHAVVERLKAKESVSA